MSITVQGAVSQAYPSGTLTGHPERREWWKPVAAFFADVLLQDVTLAQIQQYQASRASAGIDAYQIDGELTFLSTAMKAKRYWTGEIEDRYRPSHAHGLHGAYGGSVSQLNAQRFIDRALSLPKCEYLGHVCYLIMGSGLSIEETRVLRLEDIAQETIRVVAYADMPERIAALTADGRAAKDTLLARAADLGSHHPTDYLLPMRKNYKFVPARPMSIGVIMYDWNIVNRGLGGFSYGPEGFTAVATKGFGAKSDYFTGPTISPETQTELRAMGVEDEDSLLPPAPTPQPTAAFRAAEKLDAQIGKFACRLNPVALIKKLQSLGMDAQTILDVILASGGDGEQ